ncbi:hypothetical protein D3C81_2141090 [compost metagenome]
MHLCDQFLSKVEVACIFLSFVQPQKVTDGKCIGPEIALGFGTTDQTGTLCEILHDLFGM